MEAHNAPYIRTPLGNIPKLCIFGKCFYSVYIGELFNGRLAYVRFHEGNVKCHHDIAGIRGELERGNIEVHNHFNEKWMKWKRSSSWHDRLGEGHHAKGKEDVISHRDEADGSLQLAKIGRLKSSTSL